MYPPAQELQEALLLHIYENGCEVRANSTYRPLADSFGLSKQQRTQTRDEYLSDGRDECYWNNKVQWARNDLRKAGHLAPSRRGWWRLSEEGIFVAKRLRFGT